jgi:hypothetical protein
LGQERPSKPEEDFDKYNLPDTIDDGGVAMSDVALKEVETICHLEKLTPKNETSRQPGPQECHANLYASEPLLKLPLTA